MINKKTGFILGIFLFFIILLGGAKFYVDRLTQEKIDSKLTELHLSDTIKYESVSVNLLTQKISLSNITLVSSKQKDELKIDEVIFYDYDKEGEFPKFFHVSINGFQLELNKKSSMIPSLVYGLKEYGYDRIVLDIEIDYLLAVKENELRLKTLKINEDQLFTIDSKFTLGNVIAQPEILRSNPLWFLEVTLKSADLDIKNNGLLDNIYKRSAQKQNLTLEQYTGFIVYRLQKSIEAEADPKLKQAMTEFDKFIKNKKEIKLKTHFKKPFSIGKFAGELFLLSFKEKKEIDWSSYWKDYPVEVKAK
ncbi:MAG: hypothetical protein H7A23_03675 [Leptospiraceae bacterium]|nr:hypothetical protein [Leptospiraceae bacterium]MCP5493630.1 hypothetical protein [Leptospiraceae bacterium]